MTAPALTASADTWDVVRGEGAYGYIDLRGPDGQHVGAVAMDRPSGVRHWTTQEHDALPAAGLEADALAGLTGSRPDVLARKVEAEARRLLRP